MNRLLLILILTLSFQSLTMADDIRDFEVEGMSIGDSLLNFISEIAIKKKINSYSNKGLIYKSKDYYAITFKSSDTLNLGIYDQIQFHLKTKDSKYIVYAVAGIKLFRNKITKCYPLLAEISSEIKKLYPNCNIKILSVGTGLNKRPLKGKAAQKWGLFGWLRHDLFGLMLESSLDHEIASEIIGKDYIRVNSPLGKVNRRLDDNNKRNLENIRKMGEAWWQEFGDPVLDLLN